MTYDEFMRGYEEYKQQGSAGGNSGAAAQWGGQSGEQTTQGSGQGISFADFMEGFYQQYPERRPVDATQAVTQSAAAPVAGSGLALGGGTTGARQTAQQTQSPAPGSQRAMAQARYGALQSSASPAASTSAAAQAVSADEDEGGPRVSREEQARRNQELLAGLNWMNKPTTLPGAVAESGWTAQSAQEAAEQATRIGQRLAVQSADLQSSASAAAQTAKIGGRGAWTSAEGRDAVAQMQRESPTRIADMTGDYFLQAVKDSGRSFLQGAGALMSGTARAMAQVQNPGYAGMLETAYPAAYTPEQQEQLDQGARQAQDLINRMIRQGTEAAQQEGEALSEKYQDVPTAEGNLARWVGGGAGSMAGQIAAGAFLGPAASSSLIFGQGVGDYYANALEDGATSEQALAAGMLGGGANLGIEKVFGGVPLAGEGMVPVGEILQRYMRSRTGRMIINRIAEATGEGLEEVAENYIQPLVQKLTYDKEIEWPELTEQLDAFAGGFAASLVTGGLLEDAPQQSGYSTAGAQLRAAGGETALLAQAQQAAQLAPKTEAGRMARKVLADAAKAKGQDLSSADLGALAEKVSDADLGALEELLKSAREAGTLPGGDQAAQTAPEAGAEAAQAAQMAPGEMSPADGQSLAEDVPGAAEGMMGTAPAAQTQQAADSAPQILMPGIDIDMSGALLGDPARQTAVQFGRVSESELDAIDRMAQAKGLRVRYVYQPKSAVDGWISGNIIHVNLGGESSAFGAAVHETGHAIKAADATRFARFEQAVMRLAGRDAELGRYAQAVRDAYTAETSPARASLLGADGQIDEAALNEEVALKLAEQLVGDPEKMTEAVTRERGLGEVLLDFIRGIKNSIAIRLTGSQRAMLDEAERTLVNMLRGEAGSVEGERLSVQADADGHKYVKIDDDILDGVPQEQWLKTVQQAIRKNNIALNDRIVRTTRVGAKEFTSGKYSKWLRYNEPDVYTDKLRMGGEIGDVVRTAENYAAEPLTHQRTDDIKSFERGKTRFEIGGKRYSADVLLGTHADGKTTLYDVVGISAESENSGAMSRLGMEQAQTTTEENAAASANIVAQGEETVNTEKAGTEEDEFAVPLHAKQGQTASGTRTEQQVMEALGAVREEQRALKNEWQSYKNSDEVAQMEEALAQKRRELGTFGATKWKGQNEAWQKYNAAWQDYKERMAKLQAQEEALGEEAEAYQRGREDSARKKTLEAQREYDRAVQESGLSLENYHRMAAVRSMGTTTRFEEAGYILPDGRMLDLSGGQKGTRTRDHREIVEVFGPDEMGKQGIRTDALNRFVAEGNVRVMAEAPGVDIPAGTRLSLDQQAAISRMASELGNAKHRFTLDVSAEDGSVVASKVYEGRVRGERVVNDIRAFYETGVLPEESGLAQFHSLSVPYRTKQGKTLQEYLQEQYPGMIWPIADAREQAAGASADPQAAMDMMIREGQENEAAQNAALRENLNMATGGKLNGAGAGTAQAQQEAAQSRQGGAAEAAQSQQGGVQDQQAENQAEDANGPALKESAKSLEIQKRATTAFVDRVGDALSVPRWAKREFLRPIANELAQTLKTEGRIDQALADEMFEQAYKQGIMLDDEMVQQYGDLRKEIRGTALRLDRETAQGRDAGDLHKRYFGTLNITKDGLPIDSYYQDLCERYPELFDPEITHPADQAERIYEVCRDIKAQEMDLDAYYGEDAEEFKRFARDGFDQALEEMTDGVYKVRRLEMDNAEAMQIAREEIEPISYAEVERIQHEVKKLQREEARIMNRAALTKGDNKIVDQLLNGGTSEEFLRSKGQENLDDILKVYRAKKAVQDARKPVQEYNAKVREQRAARAQLALEGTEQWTDKKMGLRYSMETMQRNIRDISHKDEAGRRMVEEYFAPVQVHEAASTRMKNEVRAKIKALGLNQWESAYTQIYGELEALEDVPWKADERAQLTQAMEELMEEHGNEISRPKAQAAVQAFRQEYDKLFDMANQALVQNGYAPIEYRKGYFPHFDDNQTDSLLQNMANLIGYRADLQELPTPIAGKTAGFKPGKRWNPHEMERTGFKTSYDALKGFDLYLEVTADVIHHTEDIRNLRALEEAIRYKYGDEGIKEEIRRIRADEKLSDLARDKEIAQIDEMGKSHLSIFVQELDEYTNLLAGKKSRLDRGMEYLIGRSAYRVMSQIENRLNANMVAVNPGSWMTNILPVAQVAAEVGQGNMLRAARDVAKNWWHDDGFTNRSDFLTNRGGSTMLSRSKLQKASDFLSKPMQMIDDFASGMVTRAYYYKNLKEGMGEVEAIQTADRQAAGLMADRSKGALPTIFGSKNPLIRLITMYQVEVNNTPRHIFKDIPDQEKDNAVAVIIVGFLFSYLFNDLYEQLTGRRCALDPLDIINEAVGDLGGVEMPNLIEEGGKVLRGEASMEDFKTEPKGVAAGVTNMAGNLAQELPFVGGWLGGGRLPISAAFPDVGNIVNNIGGLVDGDKSGLQALYGVGKELAKPALYVAMPIGGGQLKKTVEGVSTMARGGYYKQGRDGEQLQTAVDQNMANWLKAMTFGRSAITEVGEYYDSGRRGLTADQTAIIKELGMSPTEGQQWMQTFGGRGDNADRSNYYEVRFGEEAADLDARLAGMAEDGVSGILPSKPSRKLTVDGEEVELSAAAYREYQETRAAGSYELLGYLPEIESAGADAALQADYAKKVQEYMAEVTKSQATGAEVKPWVADAREYAGAEGAEVNVRLANAIIARAVISAAKADKQPNGKSVPGSRKRNALEALERIGFGAAEAEELWEVFG